MSGLCVSHLSFSYGAARALEDVSFEVGPGEFCALLGPNGAGKSTLFALATRLFTTRTGTIRVAGFDLAADPRAALARLGVVFQTPTLDLDLTVRRNLAYFAALHGLSGRDAAVRIEAALDRLSIAGRADERVQDLSGGLRRRVEIARALVHDPAVLLLDEATVGLDAAARAAITQHVHDLCAERRLSVLWATHLTDEVRPDDRMVILHRGRVLADGTAGAFCGPRPLADAFLEITAVPS